MKVEGVQPKVAVGGWVGWGGGGVHGLGSCTYLIVHHGRKVLKYVGHV